MIPSWQMEAFERLRTEIVRSAVNDLRRALRKSDRDGAVCAEQIKMEHWFLSKWGQLLCENRGEYIIDKCHKTYKTPGRKMRAEPLTPETEEKAHKDYKAGLSKNDILKKHNITSYQYCKMLRRLGR